MTLKGKWRIVEMALWDLDFLDMMEPAYIFSTTKPGASSPSAASPAKSTAARPRLHLYRPTLADFFNSLLSYSVHSVDVILETRKNAWFGKKLLES